MSYIRKCQVLLTGSNVNFFSFGSESTWESWQCLGKLHQWELGKSAFVPSQSEEILFSFVFVLSANNFWVWSLFRRLFLKMQSGYLCPSAVREVQTLRASVLKLLQLFYRVILYLLNQNFFKKLELVLWTSLFFLDSYFLEIHLYWILSIHEGLGKRLRNGASPLIVWKTRI